MKRLFPRRNRANSRKTREGVAAIEFAFIALPFFLMLFAILELGLVFVIDALAESAAIDAGRLVRTGQADSQNFTQAKFKQAFCDRMGVFKADCANRAVVDVRVVAKFTDPVDDPTTKGVLDPSKTKYDGGTAQSLMLVRVWYRQPMLVPYLFRGASTAGSGNIMISATTAFRNEPWLG